METPGRGNEVFAAAQSLLSLPRSEGAALTGATEVELPLSIGFRKL